MSIDHNEMKFKKRNNLDPAPVSFVVKHDNMVVETNASRRKAAIQFKDNVKVRLTPETHLDWGLKS